MKVSCNYPFVSIIMPVRNEEGFIERSLRAILKQDYPHQRLEVVIVDGMSKDATRDIIKEIISQSVQFNNLLSISLLDNPSGITPTAFS